VFNEILTGKATLEQKPAAADPYRQQSIPEITLTCSDCGATYKATVGTPPGRCGVCNVKLAERTTAANAQAHAAMHAAVERSQRSHWWLKVALTVLICLAAGLCKMAMRHQFREDMRAASGYHESDP
jgi:hypothetical protein